TEPDSDPGFDLYPDTAGLRGSGIGGTARQWCIEIDGRTWVRLALLDPIDYRVRDWLPYSGWPIDANDLAPYLSRALRRAGCAQASFEPAALAQGQQDGFRFAAGGGIEPGLFLFA